MSEKVTMFKGRPITELTRVELLEALEHAGKEIRRMRESVRSDIKMFSDIGSARPFPIRDYREPQPRSPWWRNWFRA